MAHVPPHLPFVAGRDRRSYEGATGADATRLDPDDDEHLRTGDERFKRKANSQVVGLAFGESMESRREGLSTTALQ